MMKAIERAIEHFKSREVKVIEVPEWGDLLIYVEPMTLKEKQKLLKNIKQDELGVIVEALVLKAKDAEGNKLFTIEDKLKLLNSADPDVISRIASEIMLGESLEEIKKN
jgi:hypothetical protein